MNRLLLGILALLVLIAVSACPKPTEDTGTTGSTGGGKTPTVAPDFRESKLAKFDDVSLGMKGDEVKALFPAEGDYKLEDPFPPEGDPIMLSAVPLEGKTGLNKNFGFLEGELVYVMESGKMTQEEYDAKVAELNKMYGESVKEVPTFLEETKFWSGETEETPAEGTEAPAEGTETPAEGTEAPDEGTEAPPAEGATTPPAEGETPAEEATETPAEEGGMSADLPENALFWVDEENKLVLLSAMEDGEAGFFLMRADKLDPHFDAMNKAMEEMFNQMMQGMQEGGTTPPAEGDAAVPPAEGTTPPPAEGEETGE